MNVVIIGASNKPQRYSYQAVMLLKEAGHKVFPVHPHIGEIGGIVVYEAIQDIPAHIDTVTMYVGKKASNGMIDSVLNKAPRRIIFNPGAENEILRELAKDRGIEVVNACTLVLLRTGRF
jgi:predicted CoA-binding protein